MRPSRRAAPARAAATPGSVRGPGAPASRSACGAARSARRGRSRRCAPPPHRATLQRRGGGAGEIAGRGVAVVALLGEGAGDDRVEGAELRAERLAARPAGARTSSRPSPPGREGRPAGEHLVEHAPERVDVGARVELVAADLLGRDVVERADEGAGAGQCGRRGAALDPLGQSEVGQVGVVPAVTLRMLLDEHVAGLDVAMDEPARVGHVERRGDLIEDRDGRRRIEGAAPDQQLAQVRSRRSGPSSRTAGRPPRRRGGSAPRSGAAARPRSATPT